MLNKNINDYKEYYEQIEIELIIGKINFGEFLNIYKK